MNTKAIYNKFGSKTLLMVVILICLIATLIAFATPQESADASSYDTSYGGLVSANNSYYVSLSSNTAVIYYAFTPTVSGNFTFYSTSNTGDPYFYLVSSSQLSNALSTLSAEGRRASGFSNLIYNDDGNGGLNFRASYNCTAGVTYYALCTRWNTASTTYTFYIEGSTSYTYSLNNQGATSGGTSIMYVQYSSGSYTYYVNSNPSSYISVPSKTGYIFNGYYTGTNGSGTRLIAANGYISSSINNYSGGTLYAYWTPITYNVRYYPNGGNISSGTYYQQSATYANTYNYVTNAGAGISRLGYTFLGWSSSSSASTASWTSSNTFSNLSSTNGGVVNRYAVWSANSYSIRYYPNGGTISSGSYYQQDVLYGTTYNYLNNSATGINRLGYTFLGWASSDTATSASWTSSNTFSNLTTHNDGVIQRYAIWVPNNYSIVYNSNTGSGSMSSTAMTYNVSNALTANSFSKTDYNFLGWSQDAEALSPDYTNQQIVNNLTADPNGTVTLYAVWESDTYSITYNLDGGTQGVNLPNKMNFDSLVNVSNPTKSNYLFAGWTVSGANVSYSSAQYCLDDTTLVSLSDGITKCGFFTNFEGTYFINLSDVPDGEIIITAHWIFNEFDVTFYDYDQTTLLKSAEIYQYGDIVSAPLNPERSDDKSFSYTFLGWTSDGVDIYEPHNMPLVGYQDIDYYAVYTRTYLYEITIGNTIIDSASGNPGDQITIDYSIDVNCGISSLMLVFEYDNDALELLSATTYDVMNSSSAFYYTSGYSGFNGTPSGDISSNPYIIIWEGLPNNDGTGLLVRMVFEIKEDAGGGSYEIGLGIIEAITTNIELSSDSKAFRTYGSEGEFSDVKINYSPTQIIIQTDGTITIEADQTKIYDGSQVTTGLLSGDIQYDYDGDGVISIVYYAADGTTVLEIAPTDVGTYYIGVSASEGEYYNAVSEVKQQFIILPKPLDISYLDIITVDKTYTGFEISWDYEDIISYPDNTTITSVTGSWTNVGEYFITVRLTAGSNYTFEGVAGDYSDFLVPVSITIATNTWITELSCSDVTYGSAPAPFAEALFGLVEYSYSTELEGVYTSTMPSDDVGIYYVKAVVEGADNYTGLVSVQSFDIHPELLVYNGADIIAEGKVYNGEVLVWDISDFTPPANTTIHFVEVIDGQDYINVGSPIIKVVLKADSNYTLDGVAGDTLEYTVTIQIIRTDAYITIQTDQLQYNGLAVLGDDFEYMYTGDGLLVFNYYTDIDEVRGDLIDAPSATGFYWIGISALQGDNYNAVEEVYRRFEIIPVDNEWIVELSIIGWTYGDAPNAPFAEALYMAEGEPIYTYRLLDDEATPFSETVPTEAGIYLVMASIEKTDDYNEISATIQFEISPAIISYTTLDITCDTLSKSYTGSTIIWEAVEFNAPLYTTIDSVQIIIGQDYVNVGSPTITVYLKADSNHTFNGDASDIESYVLTMEITQANNEWVSSISCENIIYGESPTPIAVAQFMDINEPLYVYSLSEFGEYTTEIPVNVATYWVKAIVEETDNYLGLESDAISFDIEKATYDMTAISFNDVTAGYDGNDHSILISGELPSGVTVEYVNNEKIDVGVYTITAQFAGDYDNYNIIDDMTANLTITPVSLAWITASHITSDNKTYTSLELAWLINEFTSPDNTSVQAVDKIVGQNYTDAGNPVITVTLLANSNYTFADVAGDTKEFIVTLSITQATNEWVLSLTCNNIVYGNTPQPIATALFMDLGEPVYTYSSEVGGIYTSAAPINVGTYYVKATVEQTNNYTGLTSEPYEFLINPESLESLSSEDIIAADKYYEGIELYWVVADFVAPSNTSVQFVCVIIGQDYTNAGNPTITVTLLAGSNYTFYGDAGDTKDFVVTLAILQATNEWTIALSCMGIIYGDTPSPESEARFMAPGEPEYTYSTEEFGVYTSDIPAEVGMYWVKATILETSNYTGLDSAIQFSIGSLTVTKPVVLGTLTYNSFSQSPNIAVSAMYTITNNSSLNAGVYTAMVTLNDKENTTWSDSTTDDLELSWTINQAQVTFKADNKSSTYYSSLSVFTYTTTGIVYNDELSPYITSEVTSISSVDTYTLTMNCEQDINNNYQITLIDGEYTINPALITLTADNKSSQYSDTMADLTYQITSGERFGDDELNVLLTTLATPYSNVGEYAITISASNSNYTITLINGAYLITHKVLTQENISYTSESKYYSGSVITWEIEDITIVGATFTVITYDVEQDYTDVGIYTVTVNAVSSANYTFNQDDPAESGDSLSLTIQVEVLQATNYWIEELSAFDVVFSDSLSINAVAKFAGVDEPLFTYSISYDGEYVTAIPTQVGRYYVKATVVETANYTSLESDILAFDITILYIEIPYLTGTYTYNGEDQIVAQNNTIDSDYYAVSGTTTAKNADDYTITYTLDDIVNTQWTDYSTNPIDLHWTILKAELTLSADDKSSVYGEDIEELTYTVVNGIIYNDDIVPLLSTTATSESVVEDYIIEILAANDNYDITLIDGTYSITYATYDMSEISFSDGYFTYDSNEKSIYISGTLPLGVSVDYIGNNQINANITGYLVVATFTADPNYNAIDNMNAYIYISKADITFSADDKESQYGADIVELTYTTIGENYDVIVPELSTVASNQSSVGDYSINIIITNPEYYSNYNITLIPATYSIIQAINEWLVDLACEDILYNEVLLPIATAKFYGINEPVFKYSNSELGEYTTDVPFNVGTYWIKAIVEETSDYTGLVATVSFNINKATIDMTGISFEDLIVYYIGAEQAIEITGTLPTGVSVSYINNVLTNVGYTDATAQFELDDPDNYNAIDDMYARLTINKALITLTADDKSGAYSNEIVALTFTVTSGINYNDEIIPNLTTTATSASNIGEYTITITASDSNYDITLINGTYTITQADNYWTEVLIANDSIYGDSLDIIVVAKFGSVVLYYSTEYDNGFDTDEPIFVNTYYVKAVVEENTNYTGLVSEIESFMILKATLSLPVLNYVGGTVSWDEVISTQNGLSVSGVTYTVDGVDNILRSYAATSAASSFAITAIPEDTDNYASSVVNTLAAYVVNFSSLYGTEPTDQYIFSGCRAQEPSTLVSDTHTFVRWKDIMDNTWLFTINTITGNTTIYGEWVASVFNIIYIDGIMDITNELPSQYDEYKTYTYGEGLTLLHSTPYNKTGHTFSYWADDLGAEVLEISATTFGNITVYADWSVNQYSIAYYYSFDGEEYVRYDTQYYDYGEATAPIVAPDSITYFRYDCWFIDEERNTEYTFTTMPAANVVIYGAYVWNIGLGDVNGDGVIDTDDITIYRQWLVGGYFSNIIAAIPDYDGDILLRVADVNGDGVYDIRDISMIRMAIVGGYGYGILDEELGSSVTGEEVDRVVEINGDVDINIVPDGATINGTMTGDYEVTFTGTWTGGSGNRNEYVGTMTGDFSGTFTASVDANGIDTLFALIQVDGAIQPVRLIASAVPDSGVDYRGYLVTGPEPQYVESVAITAPDDNYSVLVGETLQLGVEVLPIGADTDMHWAIYVNDADKATICYESGLVTGLQSGTVLVIVKAADGSHVSATKSITIYEE